MKDIIVSVESRKGGVGKTTAALCLGKTGSGVGPRLVAKIIDNDCLKQAFWGPIMTFLRPKTQI